MTAEVEQVRFEGEFRIRTAEGIRNRLLESQAATVELDLGAVTDFDTAGVQILLSLQKELLSRGGVLKLGAISEPVAALLAFYNLTERFGDQGDMGGNDG